MYQFLIGYVLASVTFLIFPIRKKKQNLQNEYLQLALKRKGILHISHRGGSRDNMENTLSAFQHAVNCKTNVLEMDVCMTKDKQVIVIHDSLLARVTEANKHAEEFNYNELPPFKKKVRLDFAENHYIEPKPTDKIPLLEDVFKSFPNTQMNIEIKTPNEEINQAVNNLIKKYNREKITIWGTRCKRINKTKFVDAKDSDELFKLNPNIPRFFSLTRILRLYGLYITGLLPFFEIKEDSLQVPLLTDELYKWKMSFAKTSKDKFMVWFGYSLIGCLNKISGPLFTHLHKRGILVIYWVLNTEKDFDRAIKSNVHGIMTDYPQLLLTHLEKRNLQIK